MRRAPRIGYELLFLGSCLLAAAPLWLVTWPPIQDLPQHLAAVRILRDYDVEALAYADFFTIELGRTQYLAYYVACWALSLFTDVLTASKIVVSLAILGTPYSFRYLLRALGRDDRTALFAIPLLWNAHLILGFFNFIAAIPLSIVGLGLAVRLRAEPALHRGLLLALVTVLCFYTHVVPFGLLGLGALLIALGGSVRASALRLLPLLPGGLTALVWMFTSPAGRATRDAAQGGGEGDLRPTFASVGTNIGRLPEWLIDVLHGHTDDGVMVAWLLSALMLFILSSYVRGERRRHSPRRILLDSIGVRVAFLAPLAALLYFVTPVAYDWIWPINGRFVLLACLFLIVAIPFPRHFVASLVLIGVFVQGVVVNVSVARAFLEVEEHELGALDEAIASVPMGSRVVGIMYDPHSRYVKYAPFLHSVAWVQWKRGGAVTFSFADYPSSPLQYRRDNRPPPVPSRWEWRPREVNPAFDLDFYDYAFVRGEPGPFESLRNLWEPVHEGERWHVYQNRHPDGWRRVFRAPVGRRTSDGPGAN